MPRRAALLALLAVAAPAGARAAAAPAWTCAQAADGTSTCFVASCTQLLGAIATGIAHITLQAHLTPEQDASFGACAAAYPLRIARPLSLVGACGADAQEQCTLHGGAVITRSTDPDCRRGCVACTGGGSKIFSVVAGGALSIANLTLTAACNAAGDGGAISLAGGTPTDASAAGRRRLQFAHRPAPPPPPSFAAADVARLAASGCAFDGNAAMGGTLPSGVTWNGVGGAVALLNAQTDATFDSCTFTDNAAWGSAAAASYAGDWGDGGGVFVDGGRAAFSGCAFARCAAERAGGGAHVRDGGVADFESTLFGDCAVADDYWDGGGGVFIGGANSSAAFDLCRFERCAVRTYSDPRRQSLTCGGGAASVVAGAAAAFTHTAFTDCAAPRGGAVCVHDAAAAFDACVLLGANAATRQWFGAPGAAVECVQCGTRDVPSAACAYLTDDAAMARDRGGAPVCRLQAPAAAALSEWWQAATATAADGTAAAAAASSRQSF